MPQPATVAPAGPFMARPAPHLLRRPRTGNHGRHVEAHGTRQAQLHLRWGPGLDAGAQRHYIAGLTRRGGQTGEGETQAAQLRAREQADS